MNPDLVLRPAAAGDLEDAYRWYERVRHGLGEEFLLAVRTTLDLITEHPEQYPVVYRETRRALVRRFPYSVFYRALGSRIVVVACFHGRRDPRIWKSPR